MTELDRSSGLSDAQQVALARGNLSQLGAGLPRLGAKQARIPGAAGGLFIIGQQQCGDFSGTLQITDAWRGGSTPGSGGPANLPYSPTGTDTVPGAGRLLTDGSTTQIPMESLADTIPTWNHKLAIRSMWKTPSAVITGVDWTAATFKLSKASLVAAADYSGFTWAHITVAGTGGCAGWYPVASTTSTTDVFLVPCRYDSVIVSGVAQTPGSGSALLNPNDVSAGISVQFHPSNQTVLVTAATWIDTATLTVAIDLQDADTTTVGGVTYTWNAFGGASPNVLFDGAGTAAAVTNNINAFALVLAGNANIVVLSTTASTITVRSTSTTSYSTTVATGGTTAWNTTAVGNHLIVANAGTPFSGYSAGPDDTLELRQGSGIVGASGTYTRVNAKVSSSTLQVDDDGLADPGANDLYVVLWDRNAFENVPVRTMFKDAAWNFGSLTLTLAGAFTNYSWTSGDKFIVTDGTGWTTKAYTITSRTSANAIVLANDTLLTLPTASNPATGYITTAAGSTLVFTTTTPLTFTPRQCDFYYLYVDSDTGGGIVWDPKPRNNPEEAPTVSALSSLYCSWPQGHLGRAVKSSNRTQSGFGNLIAAIDGTLMNHAWWGNVVTTPRTFLSGDALTLRIGPIDTTYNNSPFLLEALLIPNFDPPRHWRSQAGFENNNRLLDGAVAFQSPPFTSSGARPTNIEIRGVSGAVQTTGGDMGGDNISHQWTCKFFQGPNASGAPGGGSLEGDPRFPVERSYTKTILLAARAANANWDPSTRKITKSGAFIRYGTAYDGDVYIVEHGSGFRQTSLRIDAAATNGQTATQKKNNIILEAGQLGVSGSACSDLTGYVPDRTDFHNTPVHWQLLIQAVHPAQRGKMGYHGYYPGEPFSCTTGNGGVLFGFLGSQFTGAQSATKLPTGPRLRCSSFGWEWHSGLNP